MFMQFQDFDGAYLERLRSGDFTTEQHFFAYFGELIRMKAGKRLRTAVAVEDVQQETFARVFRGITECRIAQPERLGAFVNAVCANVLREHYRSTCREIPSTDSLEDGVPVRTTGRDAFAQVQLQQEVRQVLAGLSKKDQGLMRAVFLEERDKDEVCREFGVSREYLRVLVYRAKQSFKARYLKAAEKKKQQTGPSRTRSFGHGRRAQGYQPFPLSSTLPLEGSIKRGGVAETWY